MTPAARSSLRRLVLVLVVVTGAMLALFPNFANAAPVARATAPRRDAFAAARGAGRGLARGHRAPRLAR